MEAALDGELTSLKREDSEKTDRPQHGMKWPQHLCAIIATLGAMAAGSVLGWTSPALPQLQANSSITDVEVSWIGSLAPVGALIGALPAGFLADMLGRRVFLLAMGIPFTLGWCLILLGHYIHQVWVFYIARFILGLAVGSVSVVVPLYNTEIAEDSIRGALGAYFQLMITVGILWVYIFGALVPYECCLPIACLSVPIIFCFAFFWMPESPLFLLSKGRTQDAEKSIKFLRDVSRMNHYDVDAELLRLRKSIRDSNIKPQSLEPMDKPLRDVIQHIILMQYSISPIVKAVSIVFGLMIFQQLSGVNAVIFYTGKIFEDHNSHLQPTVAAIIVGAVQVIATYSSSLLVDRLGRRILLLVSDGGMSICLLVLSVYFYLGESDLNMTGWSSIPLISLATYIVLFSIGLGPLPWLMMAELMPSDVKDRASACAVCLNWTLVFIVTKIFPGMLLQFGIWTTFMIFSIICVVGTIFIGIAVPETKGKSLAQIQREIYKT